MLEKTKRIFNNNTEENIILEGSSFNGTISTEGSIKILGEVTGTHIKSDKIYIKPNGKVKANLEVNNLFVEGVHIGDIKAEIRVVLSRTATVLSNISTKELVTSEGVTFQGNCKVSNEDIKDIGKHIQDIFSQKYKSE